MIRYVIVDNITSEVKETYQWMDDREFPVEISIPENCILMKVDPEVIDVDLNYVADIPNKQFYVLDVTDEEIELTQLQAELFNYEETLSNFQEATWQGLGIVEANLPQEWQDKLNYKRQLRERIIALGGTI